MAAGAALGLDWKTLFLAFALQILGVIFPVIWPNSLGVLVGAILFGGTFMGITMLSVAAAGQVAPYSKTKAIGYLTTVYALGQMLGPGIAGYLSSEQEDYTAALVFAAVVLLVGLCSLLIGEYKIEKENDHALCKY